MQTIVSSPDDDRDGEPLDGGVQAEPDEGNGAGEDAGEDGGAALEASCTRGSPTTGSSRASPGANRCRGQRAGRRRNVQTKTWGPGASGAPTSNTRGAPSDVDHIPLATRKSGWQTTSRSGAASDLGSAGRGSGCRSRCRRSQAVLRPGIPRVALGAAGYGAPGASRWGPIPRATRGEFVYPAPPPLDAVALDAGRVTGSRASKFATRCRSSCAASPPSSTSCSRTRVAKAEAAIRTPSTPATAPPAPPAPPAL
jgi:hypothetical protein